MKELVAEARYMWKWSKGSFFTVLACVLAMIGLVVMGAIMIPASIAYENKCHDAGGVMVKNTCMDPSSVLRLGA